MQDSDEAKQSIQDTAQEKGTGCRICGCTSYLQRAGGGLVCGRESCRHQKRDHGSIN